MCGIFGIISSSNFINSDLFELASHSQQRGSDSSGLYIGTDHGYSIYRSNQTLSSLLKQTVIPQSGLIMGHSRLITNGLDDNQPIYRDQICAIHNGIIVNCDTLWVDTHKVRHQTIDTEIIPAIASEFLEQGGHIEDIPSHILSRCEGVVSCALALPTLGKLCLFSNNGSLYSAKKDAAVYFASEKYPLSKLSCSDIQQIYSNSLIVDIPAASSDPSIFEDTQRTSNIIPLLGNHSSEEKLLKYSKHKLRRCTKCILPETMPYIRFDENGVCNYCRNYRVRNRPKPVEQLFELVEPFRRGLSNDCIVPFSGGRDSCYGLHLIAKELKLKPITYTYDWGMVTDLGRRNISRMSSQLGVENIIVAADIKKKRKYISKNLSAWLRSPHLGMISILTAGDKHFFRHIETVKRQTGISLNLWGVNPLEVTHFKSGFLGVPPDFEEERVYSHGALKQLRYQWLRLNAMKQSPGYFNSSLWDTLSGEYYRSFTQKNDYYHIFDYWRWDERLIDDTLINQYDWEVAPDTNTTWRIGDGTAAFYNYIYYTVAGFTEHDTFRSNQVREGDLSRNEALSLVEDENRPRYPNIKWYLDAVGMDFDEVISVVNSIQPLYVND